MAFANEAAYLNSQKPCDKHLKQPTKQCLKKMTTSATWMKENNDVPRAPRSLSTISAPKWITNRLNGRRGSERLARGRHGDVAEHRRRSYSRSRPDFLRMRRGRLPNHPHRHKQRSRRPFPRRRYLGRILLRVGRIRRNRRRRSTDEVLSW